MSLLGTTYDTRLTPELRQLQIEIEGYARAYGLDFYETIFEVLDADDLNEVAAYGGFPTRYPHWSFGMQYEELKKSYEYGLSKIYEMVINNDPCYAYLMRCNHTVDQKLVMAHVYGHCDFFKNNAYFAHTSRKMMDEMANHGARIRQHAEKYGQDAVENFLDRCMSIDDLIDVHSTAFKRRPSSSRFDFTPEEHDDTPHPTRFQSKEYMDEFVNPAAKLKAEAEELKKRSEQAERRYPERPEKDVLLFLIEHAPLKPWQRDILSIVRDEAYYFAPQGMTKIMNEGWACVVGGTLVPTNAGFLPMHEIVESRQRLKVSDGEQLQAIYDWATFKNRRTVKLRTRRGLVLEGSSNHRVMLPDGTWKRLDQLSVRQKVKITGGQNLWPKSLFKIDWQPEERITLADIASEVGCDIETVIRYREGVRGKHAAALEPLVAEYETALATMPGRIATRHQVSIPTQVNAAFASFLGYLIGDGHISTVKRNIGLTTGDEEQADAFAHHVEQLFGLSASKHWDDGRWRVSFSSRDVQDFLTHLGLTTGFSASSKTVPECILRSPQAIVSSFLRAYFDCDGYAGKQGVILSTMSERMSEVVQQLFLNFGILSRRRKQKDGCWHVHVTGESARVYAREIGFGLVRKQQALQQYLDSHQHFKTEQWEDEVVSLKAGRADVYDVSVTDTHRYAAHGFINHNSYWHSTIMTQKALHPSEMIDYCDHHCGTMAPYRGRINPYKLGIELFRDIERRWNMGQFGKDWEECDDADKRKSWDKKLGLGKQKIFEVRRHYSDITFIDTFLTPEFAEEQGYFSFKYEEEGKQYVVESREFQKVKQRLLANLTNFGKPWITVVDANYKNRGELLLHHRHEGVDLKLSHANDTLANLQAIWSRPVHLQTIIDDKETILSFDGTEHSTKGAHDHDIPH
ncbi:MAG: SpoVR family protein [Gemmatales bacterium]